MRIFNTLTREIEKFVPAEQGKVKMYVCGPTPYDRTHIGHARTYVFFDFFRRFLEYLGQKVDLVINLTDIDDKILKKAGRGQWQKVPDEFSRDFMRTLEKLNIKAPSTFPRVTNHMQEIIELVGALIEKGIAYSLPDGVYFDVSRFKGYGKLSKVKLDDEKVARVEPAEGKKNPADFAVWKFAKKGEPFWYAPFGNGRPGWHVECSAMSLRYFGETLDIHGGGADLVFPHHENEIAQSESVFGHKWVNCWVHVAYLTLNKEKMSKSLGNIIGLEEIFGNFRPEILRYYLLSAHYRTQLDFTWDKMKTASEQWAKIVRAWYDVLQRREEKLFGEDDVGEEIQHEFSHVIDSLNEDLRTPDAYKYINFIASLVLSNDLNQRSVEAAYSAFTKVDEIFAFLPAPTWTKREKTLAKELAKLREVFREGERFDLTDEIRTELANSGVKIEDTKSGPRVKFED